MNPNFRHNVVNILYMIKGMSESHLAQVQEGRFQDSDNRMQHAEEILKKARLQAEQALQITKRIGEVFAAREQDQSFSSRACLQDIWRKVRHLLDREFAPHGIEIIERIPEDFPPLKCRPEELREILYCLAKNSFQAMNSEGKFVIRAQIGFNVREESFAMIGLSDSGPGIPSQKMKNLFRPFFTTKGPEEGNGLGLYLVKELVSKNNGSITASSFEGCGATFSLNFSLDRK